MFDKHFCYDVLAGVLDVDVHKLRKGQDREEDARRLKEVKERWSVFDWTLYMSEAEEIAAEVAGEGVV